jgi:hypothetical protein
MSNVVDLHGAPAVFQPNSSGLLPRATWEGRGLSEGVDSEAPEAPLRFNPLHRVKITAGSSRAGLPTDSGGTECQEKIDIQ